MTKVSLNCGRGYPELFVIILQGTNKAMNWLKELVEGSQSSFDVLPVSCLCEFLIMGYQEKSEVVAEETGGSSGGAGGSAHRIQFKRKHRGKEKVRIPCTCTCMCNCDGYMYMNML